MNANVVGVRFYKVLLSPRAAIRRPTNVSPHPSDGYRRSARKPRLFYGEGQRRFLSLDFGWDNMLAVHASGNASRKTERTCAYASVALDRRPGPSFVS
jgi:hypothetical protein